ncbi:hypothetical protein EYF80_044993 [Liparis tanakae]|uniref:Uncharacterized protein n=1 Tax=Liparis tanakae TaxID=230148 RepID=A0A4Z2FU97_9TELE|nr:hypothetical protein EYF80_044993 [Liparis tanakae]
MDRVIVGNEGGEDDYFGMENCHKGEQDCTAKELAFTDHDKVPLTSVCQNGKPKTEKCLKENAEMIYSFNFLVVPSDPSRPAPLMSVNMI